MNIFHFFFCVVWLSVFFPSQYLLRGFYGSLLRECHGDWMHPFVYKKYISIKEIWGEACSAIMETFYCAQFVHMVLFLYAHFTMYVNGAESHPNLFLKE